MGDFELDVANRKFVRRLFKDIPIREIVQTSGYLKVARRDGSRDLRIHHGYTTGFTSREEVTDMGLNAPVWACDRGWGVNHPVHGPPRSGGRGSTTVRSPEVCQKCGMTFALNGACQCDG